MEESTNWESWPNYGSNRIAMEQSSSSLPNYSSRSEMVVLASSSSVHSDINVDADIRPQCSKRPRDGRRSLKWHSDHGRRKPSSAEPALPELVPCMLDDVDQRLDGTAKLLVHCPLLVKDEEQESTCSSPFSTLVSIMPSPTPQDATPTKPERKESAHHRSIKHRVRGGGCLRT